MTDNQIPYQNNLLFRSVLEFLYRRYLANQESFGTSFATELNNESARELAEIYYPSEIVKDADHLLSKGIPNPINNMT